MNNFILLFVGPSGCGKTTIADECERRFGLVQVASYTTRERRYDGEIGHKFIDVDTFLKLTNLVGYTYYNGNYYGTTGDQIEECQIYVIDPAGVEFFLKNYKGNKTVGIVYFDVPELERFKRMLLRGDETSAAEQRIVVDREAFKGFKEKWSNDLPAGWAMLSVENMDMGNTLSQIAEMVVALERGENQ